MKISEWHGMPVIVTNADVSETMNCDECGCAMNGENNTNGGVNCDACEDMV